MKTTGGKNSEGFAFWGEIAPRENRVKLYEEDEDFVHNLILFASVGLNLNESVIIVATPELIQIVEQSLSAMNFDVDDLRRKKNYLPLDVHETLPKFLDNCWPNDDKFQTLMNELLSEATAASPVRKIRAIGEIVAILWEQCLNGATVSLESLWKDFQQKSEFNLYCAYPKSGLTQPPASAIDAIVQLHAKAIREERAPAMEIYFKGM